ncbi:NADH dehydrogenase [ubiquinone] 1 beta subcomplex subunit 2, mitochondrial-like [Pomacea canaliculata]|uniref:NADH dehydrogenase [ubiquinone] 1 beta subcomplex subunit 2, mitochondrial-like n=1 Tax=Pomacea canaliculata TaxID=400727 RepID=UPI000D730938|nr:NADH dehydrogenase [ubiquinone] 1 beta subcomplex subunit 2, mitochondrial-like [Pomacea canaliculata]
MYLLSKLRTASAVLKARIPGKVAVRHGGWVYRRPADDPPKYIYRVADFMGFLMWYWILYHVWHEPEHLVGHFPYPDPSKWTDAELGIPPDRKKI